MIQFQCSGISIVTVGFTVFVDKCGVALWSRLVLTPVESDATRSIGIALHLLVSLEFECMCSKRYCY